MEKLITLNVKYEIFARKSFTQAQTKSDITH